MSSLAEMGAVDWLAIVAVAAAVLLLAPYRRGSSLRRTDLTWRWAAALVTLAGCSFTVLAPSVAVLLVIGVGAGGGVGWLVARRRRYRTIRQTSEAVRSCCADLADDLRMGRLPVEALRSAADRWPGLRPAAIAAELQHGVDGSLREIAQTPGAEGLGDVAAAWHLSGRLGSGLAESLVQVARLLAENGRLIRLVDAELAAARATALIVSALPILVLGMGAGLGKRPWMFFLHGAGPLVLAGGLGLLLAGWAWIEALGQKAVRGL